MNQLKVYGLILICILLCATHLFGQGTTHNVFGIIYNTDGNPPDENCLIFEAYMLARPGEVLTHESAGCGYNDSTWVVNIGNFPTEPDTGEILRIEFTDTCLNEILILTDVIDLTVPDEFWGWDSLELPVRTITVVNPNGGEVYFVADIRQITWTTEGPITDVKIEYSLNGGADWTEETASTPNDGFYDWVIPATPTTQALVRITDVDDGGVFDVSDDVFTIALPTLTVTSPNGGEVYYIEENREITWTSTGTVGNVKIEYSLNGGTDWTVEAASTANDGSYFWNLPATPTTDALVRISAVANPAVIDQSDAVFSILMPTITVLVPNGGEIYYWDEVRLITWNSTGPVTNVEIEYSIDNGFSWTVETASTPDDGLYNWTVPNVITDQALILITDLDHAGVFDMSDAVFSIMAAPDTVPPAQVVNLDVIDSTTNAILLQWNAVGDDDMVGQAQFYDIRYSTDPITPANWGACTPCVGEPAPGLPGAVQNFWVPGLTPATTYHFGLVVFDDVNNPSPLSNIVQGTTLPVPAPDTIPPDAILTLAVLDIEEYRVQLGWNAVGDDGLTGNAQAYDIRYHTVPITPANWGACTPCVGEPLPAAPGTPQTYWVDGLDHATLYYFAMTVTDEVPNVSDLSNVVNATTLSPPEDDTIPPARINFSVADVGDVGFRVWWYAPGDDAWDGTATLYDFRYSTAPLNEVNWAGATQVFDEPVPLVSGTVQDYTLWGLAPSTQYWFAGYTFDDAGNRSVLSNVVRVTTTASDVTPPARITDLACTDVTPTSIKIEWTAPGDDGWMGTATGYIIKYATFPINAGTWASATTVPAPPIPLPAFSHQTYTVEGLTGSAQYYFCIQTYDEVPNYSSLSNVPSSPTMGLISKLDDITVEEDTPDFYYVDLDTVFYPPTMTYTIISTSPNVELTLVSDSWIRVHLVAEYSGVSEIIVEGVSDTFFFADTAVITVLPVNDPPVFITPALDTTLVEAIPFTYDADAYDVDSDTIYFEIVDGPSGLTINHYTGVIDWTPLGIEGSIFVEVGITDLEITGYVTQTYILYVYKHSHPIFAPFNLIAHEGYLGSIPVTWERPPILDTHPELVLDYYILYRSIDSEVGFSVLADNLICTNFNDNTAVWGTVYYYKARAVYSYPEFQSSFSNVDMGALLESNTIWSPYIFDDPPVLDGSMVEDVWGHAARGLLNGDVRFYAMNNSFDLFLGFCFDQDFTPAAHFDFFFDDDMNLDWDHLIPSDEGYFSVNFELGPTDVYFRWLSSLGGLSRGEPILTETAAAAWSTDGVRNCLELYINCRDLTQFFAYPGDMVGIALRVIDGPDTTFIWPAHADVYDPLYFGRLRLGWPGGLPEIDVIPNRVHVTVEQTFEGWGYADLLNIGTGTLVYGITESVDWLTVAPNSGYVWPEYSDQLGFHFYSAELDTGSYVDTVFVNSNDPVNPRVAVVCSLDVIPIWPFHILEVVPETLNIGMPCSLIQIPIHVGDLHDNSIRSIEFTVYSDPELLYPNGDLFQGDYLPMEWNYTVISRGDDFIRIKVWGDYPLPFQGNILYVGYQITCRAFYEMSCVIRVDDIIVNGGAPTPVPRGGYGMFVIGDRMALFWEVIMEILNVDENVVDSASFGVYGTATDGWDPYRVDFVDLPPQPEDPNAYFDPPVPCWDLCRDARNQDDTLITWVLVVEQHPGALVWDSITVWPNTYMDGVNMAHFDRREIEVGDTIIITYHKPPVYIWYIHLHEGWNMVSIPLKVPDWTVEAIFPTVIPPAFWYDPEARSYTGIDTLEGGFGYWILSTVDTVYELVGDPLYQFTYEMIAGWNMIGAPAHWIRFYDLDDIPDGALFEGSLFYYYVDPPYRRYMPDGILRPGFGYWVMIMTNCFVRNSAVFGKPIPEFSPYENIDWVGKIHISPEVNDVEFGLSYDASYSFNPEYDQLIPPANPDGNDIEFYIQAEQPFNFLSRKILPQGEQLSWNADLLIKKEETLTWDVSSIPANWEIRFGIDDKLYNPRVTPEAVLSSGLHRIMITAANIPTTFSLYQNVPNPFNAQTRIKFAIPEQGDVTLDIYDIRGRKVKSYHNDYTNAGRYEITWNGEDNSGKQAASGIYFYRIRYKDNIQTRKLILMK